MLCQNCKKNEAYFHMKRIVNGTAEEVHLCSDCARSLGYSVGHSDFGAGFDSLLSDFFGRGDGILQGSLQRCPVCRKSFEDIVADGKVGCSECYGVFYDKLAPTLKKLHGTVKHSGKSPLSLKDGNFNGGALR